MKANTIYIVLFVFILAVVGCSGPESESTGRNVIENRIAAQAQSAIVLISFKKTNGRMIGKMYQMEYEAEIEFTKTGAWIRGNALFEPVSFEFSDKPLPANNIAELMGNAMGSQNVRQGEHQTFTGLLCFEETEKGWRGQDGRVY